MEFIRKHKKASTVLLILLVLLLLFGLSYAKYVYDIVDSYILETKGFYFNSSVMSITGKNYNINNWDGVNSYTLMVDVNSKKNEEKYTTHDISYDITCKCPDNVRCELSKESGIIYQDKKTDSFQVTMIPNKAIPEGQEIRIEVVATSNSPYTKSLSAVYHVGVLKSNFTYSIEDSVNSKYLMLNVTNSVAYYEVEKAFLNYNVGDKVSLDDYVNLSDENKKKCFSAKVTVTLPADVLALDMTAKSYLHMTENSQVDTTLSDGYKYVKSYTFLLDATASEKILFYKNDISKDYTYPIVNDSSIIDVSVLLAD